MPIRRFEPRRAIEIIAPSYGSGYRLSDRLVLTAAHLLGEKCSDCEIRDKRSFVKMAAKVVWKAEDLDIALIELATGIAGVEPVTLGRLPEDETGEKFAFQMYGYPLWAQTLREQGRAAGGRQIEGTIYLSDRSPDGLLVLEAERLPPEATIAKSEWAGASGAAIVCDGLVIAVQSQHQNPSRPASLEASPLWIVYADEQWQKLLEKHGINPEPEIARLQVGLTLNRQDWLDVALRRSRASCIARWQGAGVGESDAITLADDPSIGAPPSSIRLVPGKLIFLVGEMGAGKSLAVERLFQTVIQEAKENLEAVIPIFFKASQLGRERALEQSIQEETHGLCDPITHPTLVIIDGVDETGISNAVRLLEEARLLVQIGWPMTIVMASRPIPGFGPVEEAVIVPLLPQGNIETLVSRFAGRRIYNLYLGLSQSVQDAIRRPLFAVLLGTHLREHNAQLPRSKEQLLSALVERSLHPMGINVIQAKQLLERLAVASIDRGGTSVPITEIAGWSERSIVAESRLVVEEAGEVRFPLPVLTEWFAVQSLAAGEPSPETLARDSQRLERWQYPLVLATAILAPNQVSELLTPIVENQPALASAIINEALANQGYTLDMPSLTVLELGRQVRTAMQAWVAGLGELAPKIAPLLPDGTLPTTGVRLSQRDLDFELPEVNLKQAWIDIGWHSASENSEKVVELPPGVDGSDLLQLGWSSIYGSRPYQHSSWAWQWSHEKLVDSLSYILRERSLPVIAGYLSLEAAWYVASDLIRSSPSSWLPIPLDQIATRLASINKSSVSFRRRHALEQLEIEVENAKQQGFSHLNLPASIQNFRSTSVYSPEVLLAYAEEVYREAVEGYDYLVTKWFPKFTPQLPLASILPAQIVGVVVPPKHTSDSISLGLYWEALPYGSPSGADFSLSDCQPTFDTVRYQTAINQIRILRPKGLLYPSFKSFSLTPLTARWLGECPVTDLVYRWLWEDLKKMGWVKGKIGDAGYPYWR